MYLRKIDRHNKADSADIKRVFKKATVLSAHQYLVAWRIEKAKQALRRGESLIGTAHNCGCYEQSHVTPCFKALMGVTPGYERAFFP